MSEREQTPSEPGWAEAGRRPEPQADPTVRVDTAGETTRLGRSEADGSGASSSGAGGSRWDAEPQTTAARADTPPQGTPLADRTGAPAAQTRPVALRRPDTLGGLLLVLAGAAAAISLLLAWAADSDRTGWGLVRDGFRAFSAGTGFSQGLWQPVFVVLGGGVLLVLGLLLLVPARRHRFLGLLALLVALAVTTAVLVALGGVSWDLARFDTGIYFAMAVAALGLLGALKALATRAKVAPRS